LNHGKRRESRTSLGLVAGLVAGSSKRIRTAAPILALAFAACAHGVPIWDEIVTEAFFADAMRAGTAIDYAVETAAGTRSYVASVRFSPSAADDAVYVVAVAVTPAGGFLDPEEVERARAASPPDTLVRDFPEIGLRARSEPLFFGPSGAAYGVAFTTGDGKYDVKVSLAARPAGDLPDPDFDPYAAARRLEALYRGRRP
jgi:hypothetical protein